jgi:hypothetical protein
MKRVIAAGMVVASLALAGPAAAATPTEKKLQKDVARLKKDVAALQKVTKEQDQIVNVLAAIIFCDAAITADALQGTWTTVDQIPGHTVIGPQQAVNDAGACQALSVARNTAAPPSLTAFHGLLRIIGFSSIFGGSDPLAARIAVLR